MSEARRRLARALGIAERWHDIAGQEHVCTAETEAALLGAMGLEPGTEADRLAALEAEAAQRPMPFETVLDAAIGGEVRLSRAVPWRVIDEQGGVREGSGPIIPFPPQPGVFRVEAEGASGLVIVAPRRAPSVRDLTGRDRVWGATTAVYALCSAQSLAVGDYADLGDAAAILAGLGADFIGINPVHARGAAHEGVSPYSPSTRLGLEPGHIAPRLVPGLASCAAAQAMLAEAAPGLAEAVAAPILRYQTRAAAAAPVLRALFEAQADSDAARAFAAWAEGPGRSLADLAVFEALSLRLGSDWRWWPEDCRAPDRPGTRRFAAEHPEEVAYHLWLQWLADRQLAEAQAKARGAGMGLGLYLDLAVGVRPDGADAWACPGAFARGVSLGAPPDRMAPGGQSWGLAPFSPAGLRETAYAPFIATLRAAMRHAGVIRIDHVLGFQRAFWVPESGAPGGYVSYPTDTLLALTRLEAWRQGCAVVGEDLGTVPDGLRKKLADSGLYGCAVMQFEFEGWAMKPPRRYRPESIASWGTHDTPTFRGWSRGTDIAWRARVGGGFDEGAAWHQRNGDREALSRLLHAEGKPDQPEDAALMAAHGLLADSPAALVAFSLDDALGAVEQPNLPGTVDQHPNWRRKLAVPLEALDSDPGLRAMAGLMAERRPRP